jgi:hypothetical protein
MSKIAIMLMKGDESVDDTHLCVYDILKRHKRAR